MTLEANRQTVSRSQIVDDGLQAAVAEYLASCGRHGVTVPAGLHLLAVDVALLTGHPHQVISVSEPLPLHSCLCIAPADLTDMHQFVDFNGMHFQSITRA